jgi:DNA-binding response OmpR family regulator
MGVHRQHGARKQIGMSAQAAKVIPAKIRFERAETLVLDPTPANGESLRSSLKMIGLQRIKLVTSIDEATQYARANVCDLFLADITQHTDHTCDFVRRMREGGAGANPFLHVVLLAWKLDNDLVRQSVTCGADEFVTRPFSVAFLEARFKMLMATRADFVVTGEYIGPDRRRDQNRNKDVKTFAAPNSFKVKCDESLNTPQAGAALRAHIKATCAMLNGERIQKVALRLPVLVSFLKDAFVDMAPLEPDLERLSATASDVIVRARNSGARDVLAEAEMIFDAIKGAQDGVNVAAQIETIARLSERLYLMLNPGATRANLRQAVDLERVQHKAYRRRA